VIGEKGFEKFRSLALGVGLVMMATGCGNALYAVAANSAATKVEEARELGAEQYATYDFYLATEHLQKAQTEASEADYSDAANLAEQAEAHAEKAIRLAREAHRGAGR
jgi:arginyl-tRNA--protein-N-Asp/Glu arginylyltransferase